LFVENLKKSKRFKKLMQGESDREREREMRCEVVAVKYSIYRELLNA